MSMTLGQKISQWILDYAQSHRISTLVVGVSGGIDSAVVSTLCALTGMPVKVLTMPIRQSQHTHQLSLAHAAWLCARFTNVQHINLDLTSVFDEFERVCQQNHLVHELGMANSRSRLRMTMLYQTAQSHNGLVVGTGNKVEDFGVGFFTKHGDGGVDISPIGDLLKTEVWSLGRELGVLQEIIDAAPTDGLWDDQRTDQDQLGMTYEDLEVVMQLDQDMQDMNTTWNFSEQLQRNLDRYREIRARNLHKMQPIPVYPHD